MTTALVTGASAGLGAQFARRLAAQGHDLVLVARGRDRLEELAADLRQTCDVRVEVLVADLADRAQLQVVADRLASTRAAAGTGDADVVDADSGVGAVDLLVNNAGFGLATGFLDSDIADEERALDVMCRAVLVLTHAAARAMVARAGRRPALRAGERAGAILTVSSVAGFTAMGTYSAAKAWVTTFSQGLAVELAPHGVHVTAVCPGFTHTEFHERARMDMSRLPEVAWLDADDVVATALADLDRGRPVSVPGLHYKALAGLLQAVPTGLTSRAAVALSRRRRTR